MTREDPQMKLRMSAEMRDRLKAAAEINGRSMNAEIVSRLEISLRPPSDRFNGDPGFADDLQMIADRLFEAVGMARQSGTPVSVDIKFGGEATDGQTASDSPQPGGAKLLISEDHSSRSPRK